MLDVGFLAFLGAVAVLGFKRPFLWVLGFMYIDIVSPQDISWGFLGSIPISLIFFLAAFGGWLLLDGKEGSRFTVRQWLMLLFFGLCAYTTLNAAFPVEAAAKWGWVWKSLLFGMFLPLTLRTRARVEAAVLILVLAAGSIMISAGIKTVLSGGGYGTLSSYVRDNSGIYEGSTLSTVAITIVPLIVWLAKHGTVFPPDWRTKTFALALGFASLLVPIGTQTRTGLLCIGMCAVLALRDAKHRFLLLGLMGTLGVMAIPFLPQSYLERMGTIETHQADTSASTRVAVWMDTIDYVKDNPMGGGFDAYLGNELRYKTRQAVATGDTTTIEYVEVVDKARAYHSAYFEVLGEQGWLGAALWLAIQLLGLIQLEMVRWRLRRSTDPIDRANASLANALQIAHVVYLVGALFVGIAYQPFIFYLVAIEIGLVLARRAGRVEARAGPHSGAAARGPGRSGMSAAPLPRLDALTGIRGIAAWLVVFYHVRYSLQTIVPHPVIDAFAKGYLAVDLFFVLSGFVLWFNYGERLREGGRAQAWPFLWRRFARVWPLHGFILALFAIFALGLIAIGKPGDRMPLAELPLHVLLIQNWGFTDHLSWNDPAWSISTEFAAYLAFPLIAVAVRWDRLRAGPLLAIALALCAAIALLFDAAGTGSLGDHIVKLGVWRCLAEVGLGIVACLLWRLWHDKPGAAFRVALACGAILTAGAAFRLPETVFVPAALFSAILALALDRGPVARALSTKAAVYLGEISYSTYLSHFLLWILFKLAFVDADLQVGWVGLAGYFALVAAASVGLYHCVEKPAQRWLNDRRPGWAKAPRLAAAE